MKTYYIYSLTDPYDLKINYIGVTNNPENRSKNYRTDRKILNNRLREWINNLHESGNIAKFTIVKSSTIKTVAWKIEKALIKAIQPEFNTLGK